MPDDNKHTERVPINLTEREFLDVCREAGRLDMKPGEFIRFLVRRSMYGSVGMTQACGNSNRGSE
ncbi:hypothetical protein [Macromonas nakdongensis]|uniref:hypothetical protein n=1 Tax=Macromonas nakdongensis TaxID=1843082 RepID=UPI000C34EB5D|nr:hypothetical protein [Macromonas nakdongensis]